MADMTAYLNRGRNTMAALQSMIEQNSQDSTSSDANDAAMKRAVLMLYQQKPELAEALRQTNPELFQGINAPAPQPPTADDLLGQARARAQTDAITQGAKPSQVPVNDSGQTSWSNLLNNQGAGQPVIQPFDRQLALNARWNAIYNRDPSKELQQSAETYYLGGTPGQRTANLVATKVQPTGYEAGELAQTGPLREAQTGEATAKATGAYSLASLAKARRDSIKAFLPDPETGAPNQAVQNVLTAARAAKARGISPDAVIAQATKGRGNDNLAAAVRAELYKPQNADIQAAPPLTPKGQSAMAEIATPQQLNDEIIKMLEPYKNDNVHGLRWASLKYMAGFGSDPSTIESKISELNLGGIEAQMPFATKSRNYQYIKDIGAHRYQPQKDTFQNMYNKAINIRMNFGKMAQNIARYEVVGALPDTPGSPTPVPTPDAGGGAPDSGVTTTPDGLKWKKNPDGSMTQVP